MGLERPGQVLTALQQASEGPILGSEIQFYPTRCLSV